MACGQGGAGQGALRRRWLQRSPGADGGTSVPGAHVPAQSRNQPAALRKRQQGNQGALVWGEALAPSRTLLCRSRNVS